MTYKCACGHTVFGVVRRVSGSIYQAVTFKDHRIDIEATEDSGIRYGEIPKTIICESCKMI